ncbi:c-type cytochrome [Roseivirga seohaensis]|jgi:mono/diheme cytochrome c family protein|nr:cytochrome c [Roseivirga seohaensis]
MSDMKIFTLILVFSVLSFLAFSSSNTHTSDQQKGPWKSPKEADGLKNPFVDNTTELLKGKKLYNQMCAVCHGAKGKGDGVAGAALNPKPTNFTSASVQAQTDGAIFWKITEGRSPMASYKTILKEEQRWQLVNYLRTFKK